MLAKINGHSTAALQLMKQCPQLLDAANNNGLNPVQHAINFQNRAMYLALIDHGATPVEDKSMAMFPLSQTTSNIFCELSRDGRDALGISLYMAKKLISQIDPDDDDELGRSLPSSTMP